MLVWEGQVAMSQRLQISGLLLSKLERRVWPHHELAEEGAAIRARYQNPNTERRANFPRCPDFPSNLGLLSDRMPRNARPLPRIMIALLLMLGVQGSSLPPRTAAAPAAADQESPAEPLVIAVNRSNPVSDISFDELHKIFLGSRSHWPNGRRITLVMREPGEPERRTILHDICGMTEEQFKTHFVHGLYTGEILVSPKILASPAGVRKFIFNVPGAIGYLRISDLDDSVKAVRIDERLPDDRKYRLRTQLQAAD
jgi:hypothetical protein